MWNAGIAMTPLNIAIFGEPVDPPAAPSNLVVAAISSSKLNLSWTDNSDDETAFYIYRSEDDIDYAYIDSVAADETAYQDTGRAADTLYYYYVKAHNAGGESVASNTGSDTTFAGAPVAGPVLWVKADVGTWQDVAGTVAADDDGEVVGLWEDQSGNGNDFTAVSDGTQRPTLQTNEINGFPVIRADGVNDYLRTVGNVALTNFTIFLVVVPHEYGSGTRLMYQYDGADGWYLANDKGMFRHIVPNVTVDGSLTDAQPSVLVYARGGGEIVGYLNGVEVGRTALAVPTTNDEIFLFVASSLGNDTEVDVAEILIYDSLLAGPDIVDTQSYLLGRYDIADQSDGERIVWLKADTDIWQDTAATVVADDDGEVVGAWKDQSGKGNHFTAIADDTRRPTLKTNIMNGHPVVRFDGLNDYLLSISNLWLGEFMITMAMAPIERKTLSRVLYHYDGTDGWFLRCGVDSEAIAHIDPGVVGDGCQSIGTPNIITIERTDAAIIFRRNGEEISSTALGNSPVTVDEIFVGVASNLIRYGNFDLAELIVRREINNTLRDADEAYMAARYASPLVSPTWTELGDMPAAKSQHGFEVYDGKLYAVAGFSGADETTAVFEYDPVAPAWDTMAVMTGKRQSGILRAVGTKLYYIGGYADGTFYDTVYEFDPVGDSWATKTAMPTPREDMGSAVYDGKIYVFGGLIGPAPGQTAINTLEIYDPGGDSWDETKADMPANKWSGDFGAYYNGKIYAVTSALSFIGYPNMTLVTTIYEYNIVGDSWSVLTAAPEGHAYKEVAVIGDDLYVLGGSVTPNATSYTHAMWRYDIGDDEWHYVGATPILVGGAGLAVHNGEIYMSGGNDAGGTDLAELWKFTP